MLTNLSPSGAEADTASFTLVPTELGTDNCATHHICSDHSLFVKSKYRPIEAFGIQGITGKVVTQGIGVVIFTVTDDYDTKFTIRIEDVINLPEASKTLIFISQWSRDKKDDCGFISRGEHVTFMWDNDSETNTSITIQLTVFT